MTTSSTLLSCIARAAARRPDDFLTSGLCGDVLNDAWDAWQREANEAERRREVEQLAGAPLSSAREAARQAAQQAAMPLLPHERQRVEDCLANVPAVLRRSLRSPADSTGRTLSPGRRVASAADLGALLPLAPSRFKAGDRPVGDWQLVELLGVGGFGEVWKAVNPHMPGQPPVALKFITGAQARERLAKHEAKVLGQLQKHGRIEGVVPLLRTHLSADPPCLEFEFVEGGDLAGHLRRRGEAPWQDAAREVLELARIVGRAHRLPERIVHRDLKPANVLLRGGLDGRPVFLVADFGIGGLAAQQLAGLAHTQATGAVVAGSYSPLYASPQQMAGEGADPRDDVFALGVIWHQSLTGNLALGAPTGAWMQKLKARGMPDALIGLLASMLEHERGERPADAAAVAERIEAELRPKAAPAPPPPAAPAPPRPGGALPPTKPFPWLALWVVLAGVAVAVFRGGACSPKSTPEPTPPVPPDQTARPEPKPWPVSPEPRDWPAGLPPPLVNSIGMKFAAIPAGKFIRGADVKDAPRDEYPPKEITISAFHMGIYEVTRSEWARVMSNDVPAEKPNWPIGYVWHDQAVEFCRRLSGLPEEKAAGRTYRLPTEAEWEYACRAGRHYQVFNVGNTLTPADAHIEAGETANPLEVGSYRPNAWGLYDMHGNVCEWCSDWYGDRYYEASPTQGPTGPEGGKERVFRGGSYRDKAGACRSACRGKFDGRSNDLGFRVVMVQAR